MSAVRVVGADRSALTRAVAEALAATGHAVEESPSSASASAGEGTLTVAAAAAVAGRPARGRRVLVVDAPDAALAPERGEDDEPLGQAPAVVRTGDRTAEVWARLGEGNDVEVRLAARGSRRVPVRIEVDGRTALTAMARPGQAPQSLVVSVDGGGVLRAAQLEVLADGEVEVARIGLPRTRRSAADPARWWRDDLVVVPSAVVRRWLAHAWAADARVLTPPLGLAPLVDAGGSTAKEQVIAVPGPFGAPDEPAYKQAELIGVYQVLAERGRAPGWELHVAGAVAPDGAKAVGRAQARATDTPGLVLHLDPAPADEARLLARSSVVWSAVGIGEDPVAEVDAFDPVGEPLLRAMAAGAAPVVLRGGAADDLLDHRVNALVVPSFALLLAATEELAADAELRGRLGRAAADTAARLDAATFPARVAEVLAPVLPAAAPA